MAEPDDFYWLIARVRYRETEFDASNQYTWAIDFTAVVPGVTDIAVGAQVMRRYAVAVLTGNGILSHTPIVRHNVVTSYRVERPAAAESLEIMDVMDPLSPGLGLFGGMPAQVALLTWAVPDGIGLQARRYVGGITDEYFGFRANLWGGPLPNYCRGFWVPRDSPEFPGLVVSPVIWSRQHSVVADVKRAFIQFRPRTVRRRATTLPKSQQQLL